MCSYTARRLEANTYQFEDLALKAITMGLHQLAVELLINSLAIDEQQEETWCGPGTPCYHRRIYSNIIPSRLAPPHDRCPQVPSGQRIPRTQTRLSCSGVLPPLHSPEQQRPEVLERSRQRVSIKRIRLLPQFSSKSTRRYIALRLWRESVAAFHQARLMPHVIPPVQNCNTSRSRCCSPPPAAAAFPCRTSYKCSARRASGRCVIAHMWQ